MSSGWMPASTGMEGAAALEVDVLGFRDGFFPDRWAGIKDAFHGRKIVAGWGVLPPSGGSGGG